MPDELPKPGPIEGGAPKIEAPKANPFADPELPKLDADAVVGLEAGGSDPSGVLAKAAGGEFAPPPVQDYIMGEAAGGPPPTNLGVEAAAPVRPNTPAERALAMGTTNKSAEQIKADQDWLQAEDPARPGFKINGEQIPPAAQASPGTEAAATSDTPATPEAPAGIDISAASAGIDDQLREAGAIQPPLAENPPGAKPHAESMSTDEIFKELESLPAEADASPIQNERRKQLEAAWDAKFSERPPASQDQPQPSTTSEFPMGLDDAALGELEKQGKMTPEQRTQYKAEAVKAAEKAAYDKQKPIDAKEGESFEDYKKREDLIKQFNKGEKPLTQDEIDLIADDVDTQTAIKDKMAKGEKLNPYEDRIAKKYGLAAEAIVSDEAKRENRLNELEIKIRANNATPEDRQEYMKLRAEKDQQAKDVKDRDELRGKLLTEGKLSEDEQKRLDELESKLKNKELTSEEKKAETDRLALKMAEDLLAGRSLNEDDLERFRTLRAEQAVDDAGVESGRSTIMNEIKKSLMEKRNNEPKESSVEKKTKEKLAELMNLELQMLAVPRQLEALAEQQDNLRKDIDKKKAEIGRFNNQNEAQQKNRTELYPLMMGLARNKKYIAHYVNHGRVLKAQYKTSMADLNRTLGLNGKFGIIPDVFQHLDAMVSRAYADLKTDYDSMYTSSSGDARRIARAA